MAITVMTFVRRYNLAGIANPDGLLSPDEPVAVASTFCKSILTDKNWKICILSSPPHATSKFCM